jgi:hypothetical protein
MSNYIVVALHSKTARISSGKFNNWDIGLFPLLLFAKTRLRYKLGVIVH